MEFSSPPPDITSTPNMNFSVPPPNMPGSMSIPPRHHFPSSAGAGKPGHPFFRPFTSFPRTVGGVPMSQDDFDGKRLRKSVMRKTVDYNSSIIRALENRIWQRDYRDRHALQPEFIYAPEMLPPHSYLDNPINSVTTRFVKTATNKMRCPIFTLAWTPEGRRLVTGASSGEFTLWNGLTFNFETILQAHDVPVRTMVWSHNDNWMITGDHSGYVKYWQSNMNNVRMFQAHKEPVRGISFSPSDSKFVSCGDDGTLRIWDFLRCHEEKVLRGHGADVKCVHWHPQKALIVSGSKDNQQPIKLWDPKSGSALATLHAHKSTVMDLRWNENGNWLITASRDHLLKLFDLRNLREEVQTFRGHKKEASAVSWHPVHEGLFVSGGSDGSILFWNVGTDKEVGGIDTAHDSIVWTLAWHPLGHILCSGSNDHTIKFWTRNRPGDQMRDKYNLNTLPLGLQGLEDCDIDENNAIIPGMGPEDKIDFTESLVADKGFIPGLDLDTSHLSDFRRDRDKKIPYSKPIPRNFQAQWNDTGRMDDDDTASKEIKEVISQIVENTTGIVPLQKITPSAIFVYGRVIDVKPGSKLERVIADGPEALNKFISSGEIEELNDVIPHLDEEYDDDSRSSFHNFNIDGSTIPKKRTKLCHDHNAQLVFDKDNATQSFIPPLMALNFNVNNKNGVKNEPRTDFRNNDDRLASSTSKDQNLWNANSNNIPSNKPSPWAIPPAAFNNNPINNNLMNTNMMMNNNMMNPNMINNNMMNNNMMNNNMMNNNMMNNNPNMNNMMQQKIKPPSLFDINIEPPVFDNDDVIGGNNNINNNINSNNNNNSNNNWNASRPADNYRNSNLEDKDRRNRDRDGKRISRFDNIDNNNQNSNNNKSNSKDRSRRRSNERSGGNNRRRSNSRNRRPRRK